MCAPLFSDTEPPVRFGWLLAFYILFVSGEENGGGDLL